MLVGSMDTRDGKTVVCILEKWALWHGIIA